MTMYQLTGEGYVIRDGDTKVPTADSPMAPNINPDYLAYKEWLSAGGVPLPATPDFASSFTALDAAVTAYFDAKAAERRYDNRITCAVRAGYDGPFQQEGRAFAQWMDACNTVCYHLLEEVNGGTRPIPSFAEVVAEFPDLVWP